jgi:DNA-binding NarL/FixJ family response regulator
MLRSSETSEQGRGSMRVERRVLLADDHYLVRAGIRALLEAMPDVTVAGEASNGREVLEFLAKERLDLVLLDISMPGLNGLETLARIQKEFPSVRVIVLSVHETNEYAWKAVNLGASGYLLKRDGVAQLHSAIQAVLKGEVYLSSGISKGLFRDSLLAPKRLMNRSIERLSTRQREVLQLLAEGETTKGIALILNISNKTVEYHRAKLMQCLDIFDVPGLVRFAVRTGLITVES